MAIAKRVAGRYRAAARRKSRSSPRRCTARSPAPASANVAGTGTITIPNMIKLGYPRNFAAAVEAVASTGGQITPPIMGAGAFLMAEMLRVPYADIMIAAVLPAALFFVITWIGCHCLRLSSTASRALPESELPTWAHVGRTAPFFLLPFGILVVMLALDRIHAAIRLRGRDRRDGTASDHRPRPAVSTGARLARRLAQSRRRRLGADGDDRRGHRLRRHHRRRAADDRPRRQGHLGRSCRCPAASCGWP